MSAVIFLTEELPTLQYGGQASGSDSRGQAFARVGMTRIAS